MPKNSFYQKTISKNGITILSEKISTARSVALGVWVGSGSRDEERKISGMSHFIEHLVFKGTKTRSAKNISEAFDSMGAELNAFTAKEITAFYFRLLDEHLPKGLEILADMIQNAAFKKADIAAEKQVVLEEISLHEDSPDESIHDLFSDTIFKSHPLGKRILGSLETVKEFNVESVTAYFNEVYVPENMVISATGNIEHKNLVVLVNKFFVAKKPFVPRRKISNLKGSSKLNVVNKKTEQAHICLGALALSATDKKRFVLSVMDNILGGGMSSRLFQEIREKRGLAYSVFSYHSVHTETGSICMYVGTSPKNTNEVVDIMLEEIRKIKDKKVEEKELKRAKQHITGQLVLGLESTVHRMMRLGKSELGQSKIYSIDELIEKINCVTAKDIKTLANKIFKKKNLNLAVIGPFDRSSFSSTFNHK